jgi:hypothetical protein
MDQHLPLQDLPKFTQIWIFGLKPNHLATLGGNRSRIAKGILVRRANNDSESLTNSWCALSF